MADEASGRTVDRRVRRLLGLALSCLIGALCLAPVASAAGFELVRSWEVDSPNAIALDGDSVFVLSSSSVTRYSTAGNRETSWSGGLEDTNAVGLSVDPQGRVHVATLAGPNQGVQVFDRDGNYLGGGPVVAQTGAEVGPFDIDIDAKGDRYVAHGGTIATTPPGVLRFSPAGGLLAGWGGDGSGDGEFGGNSGLGVASDGRGNVYVADPSNYRIQRFSDTGGYVSQWGQLGTEPAQFLSPIAVAVDDRGDVYVPDDILGRVQKFDPSGRLLDSIDLPDASVSTQPLDVEVDPQGNVYVADAGNPDSIHVYRPDSTGPKTKITKAPKKKLTTTKAKKKVKVSFKSEAGAKFECRLDKGKFKGCKSPYSAKAKAKGGKGAKHTIQVRATDSAGNVEAKPAQAKFRLIRKR